MGRGWGGGRVAQYSISPEFQNETIQKPDCISQALRYLLHDGEKRKEKKDMNVNVHYLSVMSYEKSSIYSQAFIISNQMPFYGSNIFCIVEYYSSIP